MEIEITKDMIQAITVGNLKRFGLDDEWDRWHSSQEIELHGYSKEDIEYLKECLEKIKHIRKVKSRIYDIGLYLKSLGGDSSSKIYRTSHLRGLLINYMKDFQYHWLFKTSEIDANEKVAYYVNDIEFHAKIKASYNQQGVPAHTDVECVYEKYGERENKTFSFTDSDVYGKSIAKILADKGLCIENNELLERYDKDIIRYKELFPQIGKQFTVKGTAQSESESSWKRSSFKFSDDKRKNRVVIDTLDDDEDNEDRKGYGNNEISGYFWTRYGDRDDDDYDEGIEEVTKKRSKMPIHPFLTIFDLSRHLRMTTHVSTLTEYEYDKDLSEKLVLPDEIKSLITLLVEHKESNFKDIVSGKGGGAIVLLTGVPGVGKTLTAEVFAEAEQKPLYSVQASQLGTSPTSLEENLMKILRRAKRWDAIMLLDEADVYVHERGNDLQQNAIVGVFLRVLEYHASILFLTSNRADLVDDAIASRCVARIDYKHPNIEDQKKIWKILSETSGVEIDEKEYSKFAENHDNISGRDVKNLLKLAMLISASKKEKIDCKLLEYVFKFKPTDEKKDEKLRGEVDKINS